MGHVEFGSTAFWGNRETRSQMQQAWWCAVFRCNRQLSSAASASKLAIVNDCELRCHGTRGGPTAMELRRFRESSFRLEVDGSYLKVLDAVRNSPIEPMADAAA